MRIYGKLQSAFAFGEQLKWTYSYAETFVGICWRKGMVSGLVSRWVLI